MWADLTIVTSCTEYHKYLPEWTTSIINQTVRPGRVCIFTHGTAADDAAGELAATRLMHEHIPAIHVHRLMACHNLGAARNQAVALANSEWVLHLDADDTLMPHALAMCADRAENADVICAGYVRTGKIPAGMRTRSRTYEDVDGVFALDLPSMTSSNSPFRRAFWEQSPYRSDMSGAWDTALWIGFAHLGARFRATPDPIFNYRQHDDSVFNVRQKNMSWSRVHTTAMLRDLRRKRDGVAVIVPRDYSITADRARNWEHVKAYYALHHPGWQIVEGRCSSSLWCKGAAIQDALNHTNADIIVLADADCIVDPSALTLSVNSVREGAAWAMPHIRIRRLSATSTALLLPEIPDDFSFHTSIDGVVLDRPLYDRTPGGGIVVMRRINYDAIGGIPHAFCGWGSEDRALALIATTLIGPCAEGNAELIHFYHEPQTRADLTRQNLQILQRLGYAARYGKDALVTMISSLPKAGSTIPVAITERNVFPIDVSRRTEQMAQMSARRRRIP